MSILKALGIGGAAKSWPGQLDGNPTDSVRKIVRELQGLDPQKARYVAAFAYILGRVANADLEITAEETAAMESIVSKLGRLPDDQAVLVVEIAKQQNQLFGGTENFVVTREFAAMATVEQRGELLDCLFAVSAADETITAEEERQIRQIASELGFSHREYVEARQAYSKYRAVLQPFRRR
jgi:uncharacterized tellurite resistance protein B-like protein